MGGATAARWPRCAAAGNTSPAKFFAQDDALVKVAEHAACEKEESGGTARCIPLAKMHPPQAQGSPLLSEQGVHGGTVFLGKGISMIRSMYAAAAAAPWAWALAPTQKSLKTVKTEERCTIRYPTQRSTRQTSQESMVASSSVCLLVLASRGLWSVSLQFRDCGLLAAPGANQGTEADTDTGTGTGTGTDAGKTPTDGGTNDLSKIGRQGAGNHHQDWTCAPSALNRAP